MINTRLLSAVEKQKEAAREGDRKRDGNLSSTRQGVWVSVCLCVCVCSAVMTLCLWAPTEYVYLPQQRRAKNGRCITATHTHTMCIFFLFLSFALIASLLHSPFHTHTHTHTDTHTQTHTQSLAWFHITYSSLAYRKGSFFPFHSSLIFPPTCVAICPLMMQLEQHCQLPASDRERERERERERGV